MDKLSKLLLDNCYLFQKGYPDLTNPKDITVIESLLKKIEPDFILNKSKILKEGTIKQNTTKFIDNFINKTKEIGYNFKKQSAWIRLGNLDKLPSSDFIEILKSNFGIKDIAIIPPRQEGNPSSKFNLYKFNTQDGEVNIILASGANEGEKYEKNFVEKLKESTGITIDDIQYNDVKKLFNKLNINPTLLSPDDIKFEGGQDTKRNIDFTKIEDIGKTISDITINYKNKPYYISLKNKAGSGLMSGVRLPFIEFENDKVIFNKSKFNDKPAVKSLIDTLKINPEYIAQGLNDYITKESTLTTQEESLPVTDELYNIFGSIIGKGYYYVKQKGVDDIEIIPVLTDEDTKNFIGTLSSGVIKYPNINTKSTSAKIKSNSPIFGDIRYEINIRNTQGKILPLQIMVVKL